MKQLAERIEKAMQLTSDLALSLNEEQLKATLPNVPCNAIGEQIWCIIGARESYAAAISKGSWQSFGCSLANCFNQDQVVAALAMSQASVLTAVAQCYSEAQLDYAFALLEHEVQHHGQLIRLIFANRIPFPESWHQQYTV